MRSHPKARRIATSAGVALCLLFAFLMVMTSFGQYIVWERSNGQLVLVIAQRATVLQWGTSNGGAARVPGLRIFYGSYEELAFDLAWMQMTHRAIIPLELPLLLVAIPTIWLWRRGRKSPIPAVACVDTT